MSHAVTVRARAQRGRTVLAAVRAGAGLVLAAVVLGFVATAAGAHDYLVSTDPADGAVLDSSPDSLSLTFSDELLEVAPGVIVSDAAGDVVAQGAPELRGAVATLPVGDALPAGDYTVAWSVVSGDGHRIQGGFGFTVGGGGPADTTPTAVTTESPAVTETPATETPTATAPTATADPSVPSDATEERSAPSDSAVDPDAELLPGWLTGILAVAAVAALAAVVVLVVRRSRQG